ncbi:predicted protein [Sclerotinia sclerotiorum 1980 UF-70]|uniref:Uncharacterized protein n=1 Tax=Sclerotinia sclerotiorum (strain ATCC 18683 / 1980 / Ss-1) TaxID=665079 RepID=A7ETR0_SCLS1|nr:predicted protein [Sclerotinia sclerotiorum 1980 UF-70]EDN92852.1 predicted protein [Sclerotinia sclerotiorum 1980 UF-70]
MHFPLSKKITESSPASPHGASITYYLPILPRILFDYSDLSREPSAHWKWKACSQNSHKTPTASHLWITINSSGSPVLRRAHVPIPKFRVPREKIDILTAHIRSIATPTLSWS